MSGWGCIHEIQERCSRLGNRPCDPGMKGCILAGRFRFSNPEKNRRRETTAEETPSPAPSPKD